jgi:hypothetical protein
MILFSKTGSLLRAPAGEALESCAVRRALHSPLRIAVARFSFSCGSPFLTGRKFSLSQNKVLSQNS